MSRFATLTAALGALTALWTIAGVYLGLLVHRTCFGLVTCVSSGQGWVAQAFAVLLLAISGLCLVGPKSLFYLSALFSALIAGLVYLETDPTVVAEVSLLLYAATLILSTVAARRVGSMSEQSNPMNLPVFG